MTKRIWGLLNLCEEVFKAHEGFGQVFASEAEAEVVGCVVVHCAWEEENACLLDEAVTEIFNVAVEQFGECHRACAWTVPREEVGVAGEERVHDGQVALDDFEIAHGELVTMTQGKFSEKLTRRRIADGGVVLERGHALVDGAVVRGDPTDAQTCESIRLGCDSERDSVIAQIARGGQTGGGVVLRFAVDLVRKQEQATVTREAVEGVKVRAGHEVARRVVRRVDDDGLGRWAREALEFIQIERPPVLFARLPQADRTSNAPRRFGKRLVVRRVDDDVVVRFERGVHEEKDRLLRARVDEDVCGLDGLVDAADLRPQGGTALRLCVSQPDLGKLFGRARLEGQQVRDGHGFTVRRAKQEFGVEFVFGEVSFEFEGREEHGYQLSVISDQ